MPEEILGQAPTEQQPPAGTPNGYPETPPAGESNEPQEQEKVVSAETHRKVQNEAKNLRERLRTLEQAEKDRKLAEMSEADRLKAQLAEMEKRAKTLEVNAVRSKAAAKHALPEDLHEFITAEDEAGALAQAEKLAAKLKPAGGLPPAGRRNPANGGEQGDAEARKQRFDDLRSGIPALNSRVIRR